jgi:hypothetical protein
MTRSLLIAICVLIVVIMGLAGFGVAYVLTHSSAVATTTPVVTATATDTPAIIDTATATGGRKATGTIQSINGQTLTLMLVSGRTLTVTVDDQTTYMKRKTGQASLSDLQVGQKIRVQGTFNRQDQALLAQTITILAS